MKEFGRLAFKRMTDELQEPSQDKQSEGRPPEPMKEECRNKHGQGYQDGWDAKGVTNAVDWMLMAALVFRNPMVATLPAEHAGQDDIRSGGRLR